MIKLLVADSHPITRKGLEVLFSIAPEVRIVGSVGDGEALLEFVKRNPVDIVITDTDLPKLNGLTVLRHLKKDHPNVKTIIFSSQPEEVYAITAIKAGAAGFLSKSVNVIIINEAVMQVAEGKTYLSEDITTQQKAIDNTSSNKSTDFSKKLSSREAEVLKLITIGKKNKEISQELDINEKTVSTYKARIMTKLKVNNLVDLLSVATSNNDVDSDL